MWGRLSNLASTVTGADDEAGDMNTSEAETSAVIIGQGMDDQILAAEQDKMIAQLKEMIRDQAKVLAERDGELKKVNGEFSKLKLQFKSKVASLSKQLSQAQKSASDNIERSSVGSEESVSTLASESTSTVDHTSRARLTLLRKQLKDRDKLLADKDAHISQLCSQLEAKERVISELDLRISALPTTVESSGVDVTTKVQPQVTDEMLIEQIRIKESRILELDTQIHQLNQTVIDLRENIAEKDEVIRARDEAVQIIQAAFAERNAEREVDLGNAAKKLANSENAFQEVVDALQQRLLETSEKLSNREKSLEQVTGDCRLKDQSIAQLSEHLEVVNGKCTSLEHGYSEIYGNYVELMKSHQSLEVSLCDLQRERNYLNERSSSLEQQCEELTKQLGDLRESEVAQQKIIESSHKLDASNSELRHEKDLLEQKYSALEQNHAALEQSYIQLQMLNIELEQSHSAAMSSISQNDELQRQCVDLKQQKIELEQRCSDLEHSLEVSRTQAAISESDDLSFSYSSSQQESVIEQLKKSVESSESRFSKFKALAGSKIKALESEVEELKKNSTDVTEFRNRIAELEEEKGNLQLQLLDSEDFKPGYFDARLAQMEQQIIELQKENFGLKDTKGSLESTLLEKSEQAETQLAMKLELEKQISSLSAELEASRLLVCNLQVELDSLVAENADLKDTKGFLESTLLHKSDQADAQLAMKVELEDQISSLSAELEASRQVVCNLQVELDSLVTNQSELEALKVRLSSEMHVKDEMVDELRKKLHEKELEVENKTHELEVARTESGSLQLKLTEREKTVESYAARIQDYQQQIEKVTLELNVKQNDYEGLLVELKSKCQEVEKLQFLVEEKDGFIKQVDADLIDKNACIADLKADIDRKTGDFESFKKQVEAAEGSTDDLQVEIVLKSQQIASLQQEIALKNTLNESLKEELHQKNVELSAASLRANDDSNLNSEINRLQVDNDKLLSTISRLENEVVRLSDSLTASIAECELVKSNNHLVSEQEADLKSVVDSFRTQADEAKYSLKLKEEEMENLKVVLEELSEALKTAQSELQEKNDKISALLQQIKEQEEKVHIRDMEQEGIINSKKLEIEKLILKLDDMEKDSINLKVELTNGMTQFDELSNQLVNAQTELRLSHEKLEQEKHNNKATENRLLSSIEELTSQVHKSAEDVATLHDRCEEERRKCEGLAKKLSLSETRVASLSENLQEEETQLITVTQELDKYKAETEQLAARFSEECRNVTASKDLEIERLLSTLQEKDIQIKKYIVVIKKMKLHLKEEKAKTEATLEKAENSLLDQSVESIKDAVKPEVDQQIVDELHKKVDELSQELEKKTSEMSSVLESNDLSLGELRGALREANLRCESAQSSVSRLEYVRDENLRLEEELSACRMLQLDLEAKVNGLSELNAALQQDVQRSTLAVRESQVELQHAMMEITRWRHLAEETEAESCTFKATIEKLSSEVEASRSSQDKQSRDFDLLNDRLSCVIEENNVLIKDLEKSHDRSASLGVELEKIIAEKLQLEQELSTVKELLDGLSIENELLKSEAIRQPAEVIANVNVPNEEEQLVAEREVKLHDTPVKEVQLLLETAPSCSPVVSADVYRQMEEQYLDLQNSLVEAERRIEKMKLEKDALILKLEDFENGSMAIKGSNAKLDSESLRVELAEAKKAIAVLEGHLKESAFKHENNLATFEQIRRNMEFDKMVLEGELSKMNERAMKAESLLHQLGAELDTERERFSEREEELEGSSEELQLEVAKLSQDLEQVEERCHTLQIENERLKVEIKHFGSEKEHIVTSARAEYQARERDLLNKIDQQGGSIEKLSLEKERLNAEIISLSETSDKRYSELTRQYEMLNLDISTYQDLVLDLKAKNANLDLLLKQASTGHDDVASDLARLEADKSSLLRDNQNLEDEIEMMQSRVVLLAQEKEKLEDEIERIQVRELLLSQDKHKLETELEVVLGHELVLSQEVKELKSKLNEFSSTEEELEETQNRLFTLQAENTELSSKVVSLQKRVEELSAVEIEANALQDSYLALLQDNNALIRQSKEMYEKIRGGGVAVEQLQTSSVSNNGIIESLTKEVNALNAQLASLKAAQQNERRAHSDEIKELREKLRTLESELGSALSKRTKPEESESLRLELQQLKAKYEQCRAKLRLAVTESKNRADQTMRFQQSDDCPKVHASILQSAPSPTPSVGSSHGNKDGEFLQLQSKNEELLAERDDLRSRLHSAEQAVAQRDHDMVLVHQQYQHLYQQFASLQLHYTALENRLQATGSQSQDTIGGEAKVVAMLNERLQMLERQLDESSNESAKLRKQLLSESDSRIQAEDMLREQIQLHQQLSAHAAEQRSIAIEADEERVDYRLKLTSLLSGQRDIRQIYQLVRQWCGSNSILLGRKLRGQPRLRKSILAYVLLLHVYVLYACVLSSGT